jgi:Fe-S-cluster containining protein
MQKHPIEQLAEDIGRARSPSDFHSALRRTYKSFDLLHDSARTSFSVHLDCRDGCSFCCYLRVDATAAEVFNIADHIRTKFSKAEQAELMLRLASHSERVRTLTFAEHFTQNIPCPLLSDGRCSVYSLRPFSCRQFHSQDVAVCQYSHEHPDDLESPGGMHSQLFDTLQKAQAQVCAVYDQAGFHAASYELGSAILEALNNSASWRRWRNHKKPFLKAFFTSRRRRPYVI